MPLDFNEIRLLLTTIAQTDIAEVVLKSDDFELTVRKAVNVSNPAGLGGGANSGLILSSHTPPPSAPTPALEAPPTNRIHENSVAGGMQLSANPPSLKEQRFVEVPSPMVGTFYRASGPNEDPFVEVGSRVKSGQAVCIIEAMKLMNEIEAEISGQVTEILVQNGEAVEYGQPLMRINPD